MSDPHANGVSRRSMLTGLGAGAGILGLAGATSAQAASLPAPATSESVDVVVIGSGMAGCAAALEAALGGAKVVVLEKAPENRAGGNSALAGGGFAVPTDGSDEARKAFLEDFEAKGSGRGNRQIYEIMASRAREDVTWLGENGVEFNPESAMPPYRVSMAVVSPGFYMGMPRMLKGMRELIESKGGVFYFDTKAKQLVLNERGAVAGVRAVTADGVVEYAAKSVVIAAGGYAGNTQILEAYSDSNAGALMVRGVEWATGDGLVMAQEVGAGLKGMGGVMALHIAAVDPVETSAGNPFAALPNCLAINREGKRYIDESRGYVANGKAVLNQPGQRAALIFDETIKSMPAVATTLSTFGRLGIKVIEADTIEALAEAIDVPAEALGETVSSFNAAVSEEKALGIEPPKAMLAFKLETPKYYAIYPLAPGVTLTFGGIMINENAQVLEADGRVIPGLYAAGEGAGHAYFDDYVGGGALTNCLVMGRIAGRQAAA